jgi:hypothetical protein
MNFVQKMLCVAAGVLVFGSFVALAQPPGSPDSESDMRLGPSDDPNVGGPSGARTTLRKGPHARPFEGAVNRLREAESEEEKQAARDSLRKILAQVFAADMEAREKQAAEIEQRLAKLRQQHQEREKRKDEIIELQLKVLEHDGAGLGFPAEFPVEGSEVPFHYRRAGAAPTRAFERRRPRALALDEIKKLYPAEYEEMKKLGHIVESADRFAYANVNFPHGPSYIVVCHKETGELLPPVAIPSVVGALEFTEEGVVSHEADGKKVLRVPLGATTAPSSDEPIGPSLPLDSAAPGYGRGYGRGPANVPATPSGAKRRNLSLNEIKKIYPVMYEQMKKIGHIVESAEGNRFAYANVNFPGGPSFIIVSDSATGELLATANIASVVGALEFTEEGVVSHEADGKKVLRVPLGEATAPSSAEPAGTRPPRQ